MRKKISVIIILILCILGIIFGFYFINKKNSDVDTDNNQVDEFVFDEEKSKAALDELKKKYEKILVSYLREIYTGYDGIQFNQYQNEFRFGVTLTELKEMGKDISVFHGPSIECNDEATTGVVTYRRNLNHDFEASLVCNFYLGRE